MEQMPSVGRIVHYTSPGSGDGVYPQTCRAAIVAEVNPGGDLNLMIVNPTGTHFRQNVGQDHGEADAPAQSYTWHWPERV